MTIKELLAKIGEVKDIEIEQRRLADNTIVYIFASQLPFPKFGAAWYPIVIRPGQEIVPRKEIDAMLRHLWQFQLDIVPEDEYDEELPM